MDFLRKSIEDGENLRKKLPALRDNPSIEGMVIYNKALLESIERQHNIYTRLRLMGDRESVQTADEMVHVAEKYLGKPVEDSMATFFNDMIDEVNRQLGYLTDGN